MTNTPAIEARLSAGRSWRDRLPVESHAELPLREDRPDPVGLLLEQDEHRVPQLVPICDGRMRVDQFPFFRGGAAIMASDLSRRPTTGLRVQLCRCRGLSARSGHRMASAGQVLVWRSNARATLTWVRWSSG